MRKKDLEIRTTTENMLESSFTGQHLKDYFDTLPDKRIRRAISILSGIYPGKTTISDDDFLFIIYMFSNIKFLEQESFFQFVSAVSILELTKRQKKLLINAVKNNIEILCDRCTFELDTLLVNLFEPAELLQYLEVLIEKGSRPELIHVFNILRYEDFSHICGLDEKIATIQLKISALIKC